MITDKIECPTCRGKAGSAVRPCPQCGRRGWVEVEAKADRGSLDELARARGMADALPLPPRPRRAPRQTRKAISVSGLTYQRIRDAGVENVSGWLEDLIAEKIP